MDKNDIELIKNLYDISYKVKTIYEKLATTEISHGKNSKEYSKYLELLKIILFFENNLYDKLNNNIDKISDILFYIASNSQNDLEDQIYVLSDNNEPAFIEKRIIEKMYLLAYKNNSFYKGFIDQELSFFKKCSDELIDYLRDYKELLDKEEIRRTIYYISQIDNKDFILYKYRYVYLNPVIENEFINNKFSNPKNTFNDNISYKSKYDEFNGPIKTTLAYTKCTDLLEELLSYYGCDGNITCSDDIKFEEILASFKANLLFLDDEAIHFLLATVNSEYDKIEEDDDIQNIEDLEEYNEEEIEKELFDAIANFDIDEFEVPEKKETICLDRIFKTLMDIPKEKEIANSDSHCKKKTL